jgi:two-component system, NtrC family, response regulator AtoC
MTARLGDVASPAHAQILTVGAHRVIVADPSVARIYALIEQLAPARIPVLITGETGCGKEFVATTIHARSHRANRPLRSLNCIALHEVLVERELFGYETDASSSEPGLIEAATGSTLFLDEIGELALATQGRLLRVLESHRVARIGGERDVDVRIVAATNRDLAADVVAGRFHPDLLSCLSAAILDLPPLRQRSSELPLLAAAFLEDACRHNGRTIMQISDGAMSALLAHSWPGNIRELKNLMRYVAVALAVDVLLAEHVREQLGRARATSRPVPRTEAASPSTPPSTPPRFRPFADERRELETIRIREALAATGGNQTHAAALLAMPARTFSSKAKRYGVMPRKKTYDD